MPDTYFCFCVWELSLLKPTYESASFVIQIQNGNIPKIHELADERVPRAEG
jgi:hypothetical protein